MKKKIVIAVAGILTAALGGGALIRYICQRRGR